MRIVRLAALGSIALVLAVAVAGAADDQFRWRRTSPRALVGVEGAELLLQVTGGRARGVESAPAQIAPSGAYRAAVNLTVPEEADVRGAFLRLALYARADGGGRQALRLDTPLASGGSHGERTIDFVAPPWAHSVKLRLLVRREPGGTEVAAPVQARDVSLQAIPPTRRVPEVVLREPEG